MDEERVTIGEEAKHVIQSTEGSQYKQLMKWRELDRSDLMCYAQMAKDYGLFKGFDICTILRT